MHRKLNTLLSLEKLKYAFNRQYNDGSFATHIDFLLDVYDVDATINIR